MAAVLDISHSIPLAGQHALEKSRRTFLLLIVLILGVILEVFLSGGGRVGGGGGGGGFLEGDISQKVVPKTMLPKNVGIKALAMVTVTPIYPPLLNDQRSPAAESSV